MHSKEKEENGECCQLSKEQEYAEQLTYEYTIRVEPQLKTKEQNE
jgi:hypothetical protein